MSVVVRSVIVGYDGKSMSEVGVIGIIGIIGVPLVCAVLGDGRWCYF